MPQVVQVCVTTLQLLQGAGGRGQGRVSLRGTRHSAAAGRCHVASQGVAVLALLVGSGTSVKTLSGSSAAALEP